MLKNCCKLLKNTKSIHRGFCSASTGKWDLVTAVCLERRPVITAPLNELERKFQELSQQLETERSWKSDHEVRHDREVKQQESLKKGDDIEVALKETAQDLLDSWSEELARFKFADRVTEDDQESSVKSLNRKLDKHLVLLVKQQLGKQEQFLLPQGLRQDGETLRQTAERILHETCGSEMKAQFYSNAPSGFYKYKYPKSIQGDGKPVGAKIFIYLAKHCKGHLPEKGVSHKWLDRSELEKELNPDYHRSIQQFLIDED